MLRSRHFILPRRVGLKKLGILRLEQLIIITRQFRNTRLIIDLMASCSAKLGMRG